MNLEGVIVAADSQQEWLLKWWWNHYRECNSHPVTFFDLGMSTSARLFCEKRGEVIPLSLPDSWFQDPSPTLVSEWKLTYPGPILHKRKAWFSKPFALQNSPYERTVWIDLDCQVRQSIAPLFPYTIDKNADGFSVVLIEHEQNHYQNSGVLAARRHSPVTHAWAENARTKNHLFQGDDDLLVSTIRENHYKTSFFPMTYNYPTILPGYENAAIRHYVGPTGKWALLKEVGYH